jgi:glycosyltransferase involved in cell wall biosynthesis
MALGTPPIVSSDGAGPELVEDGVSGRVLTPKRPDLWALAGAELLRDPERLREMGERARPAAARFRDDVHAAEMLAVYERAIGLPPGSAAATAKAKAPINPLEAPWLN